MTKEFFVDFIDWRGQRDTLFCCASDETAARVHAYWTMGDLIDIQSVQEYTDDDIDDDLPGYDPKVDG